MLYHHGWGCDAVFMISRWHFLLVGHWERGFTSTGLKILLVSSPTNRLHTVQAFGYWLLYQTDDQKHLLNFSTLMIEQSNIICWVKQSVCRAKFSSCERGFLSTTSQCLCSWRDSWIQKPEFKLFSRVFQELQHQISWVMTNNISQGSREWLKPRNKMVAVDIS